MRLRLKGFIGSPIAEHCAKRVTVQFLVITKEKPISASLSLQKDGPMPPARIEARIMILAEFLNVKLEERPGFWTDLLREYPGVYGWLSGCRWLPGADR